MASTSWIRRLFSQKKSSPFQKGVNSPKPVQVPLVIEALEIRQLLSVTASFSGNTLTLTDNLAATNVTVGHQLVANPSIGDHDYVLVYDNLLNSFVSITGGTAVTLAGGGSATGVLASSATQLVWNASASLVSDAMSVNGGVVPSGPNTLLSYGGTSTLVGGMGNDTITGGIGTNTLTGGPGTNTIVGNASSAVTTLTEASNNTDTTFTLTNSAVSLSGGQLTDAYSNIKVINLTGGSGNDVFDVGAITSTPPTVVLDGGTGTNKLTATDDVNFTLGAGTLSRTAQTTVSFSNIQQAALTGGANDNTFTINDWAGTGTTLTGGGGNDLVISAGADFPLTTLTDASLTRGGQVLTLSGIHLAQLSGVSGNDEFNLAGWTGAATVTGGSGANNTLDGPNVASTWNFSSASAGNISAGANNIQFSQIKNFKGGSANDTFNLASDQPVLGTIDGGGGTQNVLSYATFTVQVTVTLGGISGVTNIQSIAGGNSFSDVIIGGAHNNAWTNNNFNAGFVTDDTLANTAYSSFENLVGGGVSDRFSFTGGSLTGSVSGGLGAVSNAILDFTSYVAENVSITGGSANGFSGTATGLGGGFSKITSVVGSLNSDTLNGANSDTTWNLQPSGNDSLTIAPNTFRFSGFESVHGGSANDTFQLPNGPVATSINGDGGSNIIDYTGYAGNVNVNLQTGANTGVSIQSISGGSGNNSLTGAVGNNAWTINGANSGFVTSDASPSNEAFSHFQNIIGGNGSSDDFGFSGNGSIGGTLTGRGASEVLDYNPAAGSYANGVTIAISSANAGGVNGNATGIGGGFTGIASVKGSSHSDTLSIPGTTTSGLNWNVTGANTGNVSLIGSALPALPFSGVESLVSGPVTAGHSTFHFSNGSSSLAGTVTGGGNDELDYTGYGSPVTVNFSNHSATAIFSGNANGFSGISHYTGTGNDTFVGDNSGFNTFSMNGVNIGNDSVTGGGFFTFSGVANLVGGTAGNAFNFVNNSAALTGSITGVGNDSLSFAGHTSSPLSITITNLGTNDSTAGGAFVGFTGNTAGSVLGGSFAGIANLVGTNVGDTLTGVSGFIPGGNTFTVTGANSGTYATFVGKNLTYSQIANLHAGATPGDNFLIAGGTVSGFISGQGTSFSTLSYALESNTPVVVTLADLLDGTATSIGGGFQSIRQLIGESTPLSVTLVGPSNAASFVWNITANNAGNLNDNNNFAFNLFTFSGVANLTGNSQPDDFIFHSNGTGHDFNISGVLNGGTGPGDVADYSAFVDNLTVNLATKVLNIETVLGGSGNNTLIGPATANNWNINGADTGTVNATTFNNFQNLQGNVVSDVFAFTGFSGLHGSVTGGGGSPESLDFSGWAVGSIGVVITNVNAGNGTVNPIFGGFTGIHSIKGTGGATSGTAGVDAISTTDSTSETWTITGNDAGTINNGGANFNFSGIAYLNGGQAVNTFVFQAGTNVFGRVFGGSTLVNKLDESQMGLTLINLKAQSAANIFNGAGNGISGFTTFIAGHAGSSLAGFQANSKWTITGDGNGTIDVGSITFKGFDSLVGDSLDDTFTMSAANGTIGLLQGHAWGAFGNLTTMPNNGNNAGGHDILAYDSAFTSFPGAPPISINLAAGTATNILGGIISIDQVSVAGGNSTLVGSDNPNTWIINDHNAGTLNGVGFSGFQNLLGGNDTDLFNFTSVGGHNGSVDGTINGAGGINTLSYTGYVPLVSVNLQHNSATNIDGGANNGFSNINSFVGSANSELVGKDENSTWTIFANGTGTVANAPSAPPYSVPFSGFATLHGGSGNDLFDSQNDTLAFALNGGGGNNTLTFASVSTPVTVNLAITPITNVQSVIGGSSGCDTLIGDSTHFLWHLVNPANSAYSSVTNQPANDTIFFRSFENLTGSAVDDTFFFGPNASVPGTLNGGGGSNTLDFGTDNYGVPITLDLACGIVYQSANIAITPINNLIASSFNKLVGSGIAGVGGDKIIGANVANDWSIVGPDAGIITYSSTTFTFVGVSMLVGGNNSDIFRFANGKEITGTIDGGAGNNTLNYSAYSIPIAVDLANSAASHIFSGANNGFSNIQNLTGTGILGASGDTLFGATGDHIWTLAANGVDTGNVTTSPFTFTGVANLVGNSGNDTFVFGQNSALSGSLDGRGGTNTMDFSAYGAHVNVSFANHSATPIANDGPNGFANISVVIGSNDTSLFGPNASNLWSITGINSGSLTSNDGVNPPSTITFSGVADLVGNYRDDTFVFSNDGNVTSLDGGTGEHFIDLGFAIADQGQYIDTVNYSNASNTTGKLVNLNKFVDIEAFIGTATHNDTLQGSNNDTLWQISGANSGSLGFTDGFGFHAPTFSNYGTLTGGTEDNTFSFTSDGSLTGSVNGGATTDQTVDFSTFGVPLKESISSQANATTNSGNISFANNVKVIGGGFTNIQSLSGSGILGVGGDSLTGASGSRTWNLTGPDSGSVGNGVGPALSFAGIANLQGNTGSDVFQFNTGSSVSGTVDGGSSLFNTDTLDYSGFAGDVTVNLNTGAATAIDGGSKGGFSSFEALNGSTGRTILVGPNSSGLFGTTWNITSAGGGTVSTGLLSTLAFSAVDDLVGGAGDDTFAFGANGSIPEAIDGGAGNNTLDYSNYGSAVTTNLGLQTSTALGSFVNISEVVGDSNTSLHGTLIGAGAPSTWSITGSDSGNVNGFTFLNIRNVTGGGSFNAFVISSTGSLRGTITGGPVNTLSVTNSGSGGSFVLSDTSVSYGTFTTTLAGTFTSAVITASGSGAHIFDVAGWTTANGLASLIGGSGNDTVVASSNTDIALSNAFLQFASTNRFSLTSIDNAILTQTGSAGHSFRVDGWTGARTATLDGGAAGAALSAFGDFGFTLAEGSFSKTTGGNVTFTNIHQVDIADFGANHLLTINGWLGTGNIHGSASDTLVNNAAGNIKLTDSSLSTAAGLNQLNLSGITKAVIQSTDLFGTMVDATGFTGSTTLVGGVGPDLIKAGSGKSILLGGGGNDTLIGGAGFNILVGGSGNDAITGNSAVGSIIIGGILSSRYFTQGSTLTAAQLSALSAVMAEWSSANSLTTRVQHLLNGGGANGLNLINPSTVSNDSATNSLTGDSAGDWFLINTLDNIFFFNPTIFTLIS